VETIGSKMKNFILSLIIGTLFLGCTVKNSSLENSTNKAIKELSDTSENIPHWLKDTNSLDALGAIGSAYKTTGGSKFQQTEAMANGRDILRDKIKRKVSTVIEKLLEELLVDSEMKLSKVEILEIAEKIGTHISLQSISGSKKRAVWFDKKENLYVMVTIDALIIKELTVTGTRVLLSNYRDLYTLFKREKGREILIGILDKEIYN